MASAAIRRLVTPRDIEILAALDLSPMTASQLLRLSQTFDSPFGSDRRVRERLHQLGDAGRVHRWQYATAGQGAPNYYTLSRLGYRLLHGEEATPPARRTFQAVGIARQHHTQCLADFLVHTIVCAHRAGLTVTGFARENALQLQIDDEVLFPDGRFQLVTPGGGVFTYFIEIDAGSERIRSVKDVDSWERKIRLYDRYQDLTEQRFRVLAVSTRSVERPTHILTAAAQLVRNSQRSLVYAISLPTYLAADQVLTTPCFRDQRGNAVALVPPRYLSATRSTAQLAAIG